MQCTTVTRLSQIALCSFTGAGRPGRRGRGRAGQSGGGRGGGGEGGAGAAVGTRQTEYTVRGGKLEGESLPSRTARPSHPAALPAPHQPPHLRLDLPVGGGRHPCGDEAVAGGQQERGGGREEVRQETGGGQRGPAQHRAPQRQQVDPGGTALLPGQQLADGAGQGGEGGARPRLQHHRAVRRLQTALARPLAAVVGREVDAGVEDGQQGGGEEEGGQGEGGAGGGAGRGRAAAPPQPAVRCDASQAQPRRGGHDEEPGGGQDGVAPGPAHSVVVQQRLQDGQILQPTSNITSSPVYVQFRQIFPFQIST